MWDCHGIGQANKQGVDRAEDMAGERERPYLSSLHHKVLLFLPKLLVQLEKHLKPRCCLFPLSKAGLDIQRGALPHPSTLRESPAVR